MRLKVLGTQSPYNTDGHHSPGFLISDGDVKLMLDCGSGSHSLLNFPNDLNNLSIIISHLHGDHYNDIYNLQYTAFSFHNLKIIEKPIDVYLPQNPNNLYDNIVNYDNAFANYHAIDENSNITIGNINISFCQTDHPVETYAIKISNGEKTIVYTADTSFSAKDRIVEFAKNADLLICESSLLKAYGFPEINSHLTAEQAGIIAREAKVKVLMLTHFWPEEQPEKFVEEAKTTFQKVIAASEGQTIDFPNIKDSEKDMR